MEHWNHTVFDLAPVLDALEADRANLARFRQTAGAKSIGDFLDLLAADLDEIERTARELAAFDGPHWDRPYPLRIPRIVITWSTPS